MYELKKKIGKELMSKSVGTGPPSYEKRIYRAAVSQRLRSTALRKGNEATEREALDWNLQAKRRRGRPRHTWRRTVCNEALEKGKSWNEEDGRK